MTKTFLSAIILFSSYSVTATAMSFVCRQGEIQVAAQVIRDSGCRSKYAILYSTSLDAKFNQATSGPFLKDVSPHSIYGRCLADDSLEKVDWAKLNSPYQACVKELSGIVGGNYIASIEKLGMKLNP